VRGKGERVEGVWGGASGSLAHDSISRRAYRYSYMSTEYTHLCTLQTCRKCHREKQNAFCMPPPPPHTVTTLIYLLDVDICDHQKCQKCHRE